MPYCKYCGSSNSSEVMVRWAESWVTPIQVCQKCLEKNGNKLNELELEVYLDGMKETRIEHGELS